MNPLTESEVRLEIEHGQEYSTFDHEGLERFLGVWRDRLQDAIHYHKREDLRNLAEKVIRFAEDTGPLHLKLYARKITSGDQTAFLYNTSNGSFIEIKA